MNRIETEADLQQQVEELTSQNQQLLLALKGMMEWARRVKGPNPGPEIRNAHVAIGKAEGSL